MQSKIIFTLLWPLKTSDINIIENVWSLIARRVYSDRRVYSTLNGKKADIKDASESLCVYYLQKHYRTIPRRLFLVIDAKEDDTKY